MRLSRLRSRTAAPLIAGLIGAALFVPSQVSSAAPPVEVLPQKVASVPGKDFVPATAVRPKTVTPPAHPTPARQGVRAQLESVKDGKLHFRLPSARAKSAGTVRVSLDYSAYLKTYGADWASRLQVQPAAQQVDNDTTAGVLSADVPAGAQTFTVAAAASGGTGDYKATSLAPSGTWEVNANNGAFTWGYALRTPPVPGGLEPDLSAGYSSQATDGRTVATNNQSSWLGEGWDLGAGSIERSYKSCADDLGGNNAQTKTGDLCWETDNATVSLGEQSGQLVRENGVWHLKDDNGTKVERLTGAVNGDNDGEYWKLTTTDGTQYLFGLNRLPGWTTGKATTQSAWTAPVYGNDSGEPCNQATYAASACQQAYRWNLDEVIDPHGNTMNYYYDVETNQYAQNLGATTGAYTRGGVLRRIDYGTRSDNAYADAPARVVFDSADRCVPGQNCATHTATSWPDVPWDLECKTAPCTTVASPTFWSTKRLSRITTQVSLGGGAYRDVDRWDFAHSYPAPGDGTAAGLWLSSITHTGVVGTPVATPPVTFTPTLLPNRVDTPTDSRPALWKPRITTITNETGGQVTIKYADPDCTPTSLPTAADTNGKRCYPVKWMEPPEETPRDNWFHKYVVQSTLKHDLVTDNRDELTAYVYEGDAAWAYDDNPLVDPKDRTWSQWRGYEKVVVVKGDEAHDVGVTRTAIRYQYFRGMNGDKLANGGTKSTQIVDTTGTSTPDLEQYAGFMHESITYLGVGGGEVSAEIHDPWSRLTATEGTEKAYQVEDARTRGRTTLSAGGVRRTDVSTTYDNYGNPTQTDDLGDTAIATDDRCTTTKYVQNPTAMLMRLQSEQQTIGVACGTAPSLPADAISDTRTSYDGAAFGTAPVRGDVTRSEQAKAYSGGVAQYLTTSTSTYDAFGRPLVQEDPLRRKTTTAYTDTNGLNTGTSTTNALGHVTTTTLDPAWAQPVKEVDANQRVTSSTYDALGRLSKVWQPGRTEAVQQAPHLAFVYGVRQSGGPSWIETLTLRANGNQLASYSLLDGFGRERQAQKPSPAGGRILSDTEYDSRGLAVVRRSGYYNSDAGPGTTLFEPDPGRVPSATVTTYDGAERKTSETFSAYNVGRWTTYTTYGGDRVTVLPPQGGTLTTTVTDARGRTTAQLQYQGRSTSTPADTTSYGYTKRGDLERITDAAGNVWRYEYDALGHQVRVDDPDKGVSELTYDDAGQLIAGKDARGRTTQTEYDDLGRKVRTKAGDTVTAEWTYDTLDKGSLTASTRYVGTDAYVRAVTGYDAAGRATGERVTIPATQGALAGVYETTQRFADDGSLKSTRLPKLGDLPAETVNYEYDTLGLQDKVTGAIPYVQDTRYTGLAEVTQLLLGSDARPLWRTTSYDDTTRRMVEVRTDRDQSGGLLLDKLTYGYDQMGNVTKAADQVPSSGTDTQCFSYDYLRRVKTAWTATDGCAAAPSTTVVGGPAPYWQEFSYDVVGNRTGVVAKGLAGAADVVSTYSYDRPHAVASVRTGATTKSYSYDAAGNTVAQPGQSLTWDDEGRLAAAGTSSYIYDADGNQLIRRDKDSATLFVANGELTAPTGGTAKGTRYYDGIGTRTASGFTWTVPNRDKTAQTAISEANLQVTNRRLDLFGAARGATAPWTGGTRGFVGGTPNADTGLTRLGAREYDPAAGRFLSVDPVIDPQDPQQLNPYAYANNSPATFSDPDGLRYFEGDSGKWVDAGVYRNGGKKRSNYRLGDYCAMGRGFVGFYTWLGASCGYGGWWPSAADNKKHKPMAPPKPKAPPKAKPKPKPILIPLPDVYVEELQGEGSTSTCIVGDIGAIEGRGVEGCFAADGYGFSFNGAYREYTMGGASAGVSVTRRHNTGHADEVNSSDGSYITTGIEAEGLSAGATMEDLDPKKGYTEEGYGLTGGFSVGQAGESHGANSGYFKWWWTPDYLVDIPYQCTLKCPASSGPGMS
ncbi:RHS repeat-associated core domain-containing protein [Kribbella sp. NPDC000426]|uniref:RHS repeat-associated core domain-containing protein n=1 Tax=Kribbella sp. NPDC000426 TaxID=3154255 RepID=UPI003323D0AF